jgi:hypothetical protein
MREGMINFAWLSPCAEVLSLAMNDKYDFGYT